MKLDISKLLPWILSISIVGGAIFAYAQTSTKHAEKIKSLTSRVEKDEHRRDEQYKELTKLFREMDRKLTRALTLLGDKK